MQHTKHTQGVLSSPIISLSNRGVTGIAHINIGLDGVKGALAACQGALGTTYQSEHREPQSRMLAPGDERAIDNNNG
ncbi:hypothetical protein GGI43DRAFT_334310 [Trichoderma evansii]